MWKIKQKFAFESLLYYEVPDFPEKRRRQSENEELDEIFSSLPLEIKLKILSKAEGKSVKNCMSLSNFTRSYMLKVPRVMEKFTIKYDGYWEKGLADFQNFMEFLKKVGKNVKRLKLSTCEEVLGTNYLDMILELAPNLEELQFMANSTCAVFHTENHESYKCMHMVDYPEPENPLKMPKLKVLHAYAENFRSAYKVVQNVETIEDLKLVSIDGLDQNRFNSEVVTDFISQQKNLKNLTLNGCRTGIFPSRDISQEVKFKLQSFSTNSTFLNCQNFKNFLRTQADCLEELELNLSHNGLAEIDFGMFKNLKNLKIKADLPCQFYRIYSMTLSTVTEFEDSSKYSQNLMSLVQALPNLEKVKITEMTKNSETFEKITSLELTVLKCDVSKDTKFPNLNHLRIVKELEFKTKSEWENFAKNLQNIETLKIATSNQNFDVEIVLQYLKIFKNLREFEYAHPAEKYDQNSLVFEDKHARFFVNFDKKTLMFGSNGPRQIIQLFKNYFDTFDSHEFKVEPIDDLNDISY